MKRTSLTLVAAFALITTTASAQNVTIFEVQESGGVVVFAGNITFQEAAILLGDDAPPKGATGVVLEEGNPPRWTGLSNQELNEAFEGEGEPAIKLRKKPEVIELDDPDQPSADLDDPFTDWGNDTSARIDPIPGYWIGEMQNQTVTDCPAGTADTLTAQLAVLNGSKLEFTIDESFDPSGAIDNFIWEKTGTNSWLGDLASSQGPGGFRVQWAMRIMSPTLIKTRQQMAIALLGDACTVVTEVDYGRAN